MSPELGIILVQREPTCLSNSGMYYSLAWEKTLLVQFEQNKRTRSSREGDLYSLDRSASVRPLTTKRTVVIALFSPWRWLLQIILSFALGVEFAPNSALTQVLFLTLKPKELEK